jgi:hypothetical protein
MIIHKLHCLRNITLLLIICGIILLPGSFLKNLHAAARRIIVGQLIDINGRPISQYPVTFVGIEKLQGKTYHGVTDFSGTFQFYNLPGGKYKIAPINQPSIDWKEVFIKGKGIQKIAPFKFPVEFSVDFNDAVKRVINPEAAKVINPEAAKVINPEAAKVINPEAAKNLNPSAAKSINPEAAKVLNPDRAKVLTEKQAKFLSPEEAAKPILKE